MNELGVTQISVTWRHRKVVVKPPGQKIGQSQLHIYIRAGLRSTSQHASNPACVWLVLIMADSTVITST